MTATIPCMLMSFPRHAVVGEVEWPGGSADARGVVEVPGDVSVTLYISGDEPVDLGFMRGLPGGTIVDLNIQGPLVHESFEAVTHLAPGLRYLQLTGTDLGDDALRSVAQLRGLVQLQCLDNGFTSDGLQALTALEGLEYLCLEEEGLSATGLEFVARLPRLRRLTGLVAAGMNEEELSKLRAMVPHAEIY